MFVGLIRDISQRESLEKQLRHARKMEAVGALVGGVAHNFNNLLAGIVGKAYLAKRKAQDTPLAILIREAYKTARLSIPENIKLDLRIMNENIIVHCDAGQGTTFRIYLPMVESAIITDVTMPEMSGVEMFRHIRTINSQIPGIFITGYDRGQIELTTDEQINTLILSKPVQIPALSQHIESMLKQ